MAGTFGHEEMSSNVRLVVDIVRGASRNYFALKRLKATINLLLIALLAEKVAENPAIIDQSSDASIQSLPARALYDKILVSRSISCR